MSLRQKARGSVVAVAEGAAVAAACCWAVGKWLAICRSRMASCPRAICVSSAVQRSVASGAGPYCCGGGGGSGGAINSLESGTPSFGRRPGAFVTMKPNGACTVILLYVVIDAFEALRLEDVRSR